MRTLKTMCGCAAIAGRSGRNECSSIHRRVNPNDSREHWYGNTSDLHCIVAIREGEAMLALLRRFRRWRMENMSYLKHSETLQIRSYVDLRSDYEREIDEANKAKLTPVRERVDIYFPSSSPDCAGYKPRSLEQ